MYRDTRKGFVFEGRTLNFWFGLRNQLVAFLGKCTEFWVGVYFLFSSVADSVRSDRGYVEECLIFSGRGERVMGNIDIDIDIDIHIDVVLLIRMFGYI